MILVNLGSIFGNEKTVGICQNPHQINKQKITLVV